MPTICELPPNGAALLYGEFAAPAADPYNPELYGDRYVTVDCADGEQRTLQLISYFDDDPVHEPMTNRIRQGLRTKFIEDGLLKTTAELDDAVGPNVEFFALVDPETGEPVASLRKIYAPVDEPWRLPSYKKFAELHAFDPAALAEFEAAAAGRQVVEIGRLWKNDNYGSRAKIALYRAALQESFVADQLWFMGMVPGEYMGIKKLYGDEIVRTIGQPIPVEEEDAVETVRLRPVWMDPRTFYISLLDQSDTAARRGDEKVSFFRMGAFWDFMRGLNVCDLDRLTQERLERFMEHDLVG